MIYDTFLGATPPPLDLSNPAVLKEVKFLMLMLVPELGKDPTWLTSGWSEKASTTYKEIWKKLGSGHGSIAHTEGGAAKLGLSEQATSYYPSIYGIDAMGNAILASGDMTQQQLQDASPMLRAYGKANYGQKPVGAGVLPPREGGDGSAKSGGAGWLVGGLLAVAAVAVFSRKV
ncbi:MAG: hypothetical protein AMXMBFR58_38470 [Phycisphaerae bacterium]